MTSLYFPATWKTLGCAAVSIFEKMLAEGTSTTQRPILATLTSDRTKTLVCTAGSVIQGYDRPSRTFLETNWSTTLRNGDSGRKWCNRVNLDHEIDFCWCVGSSISVFWFKRSSSLPHRSYCWLHQWLFVLLSLCTRFIGTCLHSWN